MKVIIDYEFKAKVHNVVDLEDFRPKMTYDEFIKEIDKYAETSFEQILKRELPDDDISFVNIERVSLIINKAE